MKSHSHQDYKQRRVCSSSWDGWELRVGFSSQFHHVSPAKRGCVSLKYGNWTILTCTMRPTVCVGVK